MGDDELFETFCASAIPADQWTHEAHLRVAFCFATRFGLDEAHLRMRAGIIRMNERHGLVETGARGYFETLTRVWLALVADAARRTGGTRSQDVLRDAPELQDRELPLRHYARETLMSVRARSIFVEPDVSPLPS